MAKRRADSAMLVLSANKCPWIVTRGSSRQTPVPVGDQTVVRVLDSSLRTPLNVVRPGQNVVSTRKRKKNVPCGDQDKENDVETPLNSADPQRSAVSSRKRWALGLDLPSGSRKRLSVTRFGSIGQLDQNDFSNPVKKKSSKASFSTEEAAPVQCADEKSNCPTITSGLGQLTLKTKDPPSGSCVEDGSHKTDDLNLRAGDSLKFDVTEEGQSRIIDGVDQGLMDRQDGSLDDTKSAGDEQENWRVNTEVTEDIEELAVVEAYRKLYSKYQQCKERQFSVYEAAYDEQTSRFASFSAAADAFVRSLQEENEWLRRRLREKSVDERENRSRRMDEDIIDCRNELVLERAKVLELERNLKEARQCIVDLKTSFAVRDQQLRPSDAPRLERPLVESDREPLPRTSSVAALPNSRNEDIDMSADCDVRPVGISAKDDPCSVQDSKCCSCKSSSERRPKGFMFLHQVLQNILQLSIASDSNSSGITCTHDGSGFSFRLEQNDISKLVGGKRRFTLSSDFTR